MIMKFWWSINFKFERSNIGEASKYVSIRIGNRSKKEGKLFYPKKKKVR